MIEAARKIEIDAKSFNGKATYIVEKDSDQTTEITEIAYDKLKKGVSETYDVISKTIVDDPITLIGKKDDVN